MTQVIGKMKLLKWWMPLLLVAALVAAGGLAWSQSGSGGSFDTSSLPGITDINPAYDDQIVVPGEAAPIALWTVTMDPPTSLIALGGGDMTTVTVTNNIPAPLNNGTGIGRYGPYPGVPQMIMDNGDLTGDLIITADVYNVLNPMGCIAVYPTSATQHGVVVKVYDNITVHPGGTVTFTCPVLPGMGAIPGGEFMLKAEFVNVTGLTSTMNPSTAAQKMSVLAVYPYELSLATPPSALLIMGLEFGTVPANLAVTFVNNYTATSYPGTVISTNGGVLTVMPVPGFSAMAGDEGCTFKVTVTKTIGSLIESSTLANALLVNP